MAEETVLLRLSTKHINLWVRQLEMKRKEICELAELMGFEEIKEIEMEKTLQRWARRVSNIFPRKTKRVIFEMTDNMVWSWEEKVILEWCRLNKVYDETGMVSHILKFKAIFITLLRVAHSRECNDVALLCLFFGAILFSDSDVQILDRKSFNRHRLPPALRAINQTL